MVVASEDDGVVPSMSKESKNFRIPIARGAYAEPFCQVVAFERPHPATLCPVLYPGAVALPGTAKDHFQIDFWTLVDDFPEGVPVGSRNRRNHQHSRPQPLLGWSGGDGRFSRTFGD